MAPHPCCVGIDVSKAHLDVAILPGPTTTRVANTPRGWQVLLRQLPATGPVCIALEATGRYHRGVAAALAAANHPAAILNPAWTHAFARSEGRLAKTDRVDALVLARYAEQKQPAPTPLPSASTTALTDLAAYREDLVAMRTMEQNRVQVLDESVRPFLAQHIATLGGQIAAVEQELAQRIAADAAWTARVAQLQTVPGLSRVLAPQLALGLPELGTLDRRAIASLAGIAPHPRESGTKAKTRPVRGGRVAMRRVLYLMALTATRHDPVIKQHYEQLLARGKAKKVALLACARRVLGIINAMVRDGLTWQQTKVGQGQFLPSPP